MELKELLGEELYKQVEEKVNAAKAKVEIVSTGEWIPKSKFDEVNSAKGKLEESLKDRDKQLESLKHDATGAEDLKAKIAELQDENKAKKSEYEKALKEERLNGALRLSLKGAAYDPDIVIGMLDREKLTQLEDGSVTGLDEQLKSLREEKGFLFVEESKPEEANRFRAFSPKTAEGESGSTMEQAIDKALENL